MITDHLVAMPSDVYTTVYRSGQDTNTPTSHSFETMFEKSNARSPVVPYNEYHTLIQQMKSDAAQGRKNKHTGSVKKAVLREQMSAFKERIAAIVKKEQMSEVQRAWNDSFQTLDIDVQIGQEPERTSKRIADAESAKQDKQATAAAKTNGNDNELAEDNHKTPDSAQQNSGKGDSEDSDSNSENNDHIPTQLNYTPPPTERKTDGSSVASLTPTPSKQYSDDAQMLIQKLNGIIPKGRRNIKIHKGLRKKGIYGAITGNDNIKDYRTMTKYCVTLEGVSRKELMADVTKTTHPIINCLKTFIDEELNDDQWSSTINYKGAMEEYPDTIIFVNTDFLERKVRDNSRGGHK